MFGVTRGVDARDDGSLLRDVARGDEHALACLYDRHAGWLTVRLSRRCASQDLVDHAVQDTFLAIWREAGHYRGSGDVAAFIWGIGVRRLVDSIRRERGVRRVGWPGREGRLISLCRLRITSWRVSSMAVWGLRWRVCRRSCARLWRQRCWMG